MKKLLMAVALFTFIAVPSTHAKNGFLKKVWEKQYRKTDEKLRKLQRKAGKNPTPEQRRKIDRLQKKLMEIKRILKK